MASNTVAKLKGNPLPFIYGGNATFTVVSLKTQARYTYRVSTPKSPNSAGKIHFVKVLTGENSYTYIGAIRNGKFGLTAASKMPLASTPVAAFNWVLSRLAAGQSIDGVEFWHAGKCGRCGRALTVPASIETGFGPECAGKVA